MKEKIKNSPTSSIAIFFGALAIIALILVELGLIEGSKALTYDSNQTLGNQVVLILACLSALAAFASQFTKEEKRLKNMAFFAMIIPLAWYFSIIAILVLIVYVAWHNFF